MVIVLLMVVYVSIAFEVDRRKRICISFGRKYTYRKRIKFKKKCARLIDTLLFRNMMRCGLPSFANKQISSGEMPRESGAL